MVKRYSGDQHNRWKTPQATTIKNPIGRIPAMPHHNKKSLTRGLSTSDLQDIAGVQISIYNDLSELTQMIRGANHKTLVKNLNDQASTGAGGVIIMDPDTPSGKLPYLLQADASALTGLLNTIDKKTEMVNRMAHITPVRTYRAQVVSAVAMETEFQILNTLLADKAAREAAAMINSTSLQTELNKQLAHIALPDDDLIEKIDKELSKGKGGCGGASTTGCNSSPLKSTMKTI